MLAGSSTTHIHKLESGEAKPKTNLNYEPSAAKHTELTPQTYPELEVMTQIATLRDPKWPP